MFSADLSPPGYARVAYLVICLKSGVFNNASLDHLIYEHRQMEADRQLKATNRLHSHFDQSFDTALLSYYLSRARNLAG